MAPEETADVPVIDDDELAQFEEHPASTGTEAPTTEPSAPSPEASAETAPDPAAPPRSTDGRFKKQDAAPKPAGDALPDAKASAQPAAANTTDSPASAAAAQAQWAPLVVKADREDVPIDGAQILRENGHAMIVMPEANLPRVTELLSRGVHSERTRRQFEEERKAFAAEKARPQPPSESEIEAKVILEVLKPHLAELFGDGGVQWLSDKVKLAKLEAQNDHRTKIETQSKEGEQSEALDGQKQRGLAHAIETVWTSEKANLPGLTKADVEKAYAKLLPFRNALYTQENGEWFLNTEAILAELKERSETNVRHADAVKKATDAQNFNRRQAAPLAAPPVPAKKGAAAAPAKSKHDPKTFDEAKFLRGEYDTDAA